MQKQIFNQEDQKKENENFLNLSQNTDELLKSSSDEDEIKQNSIKMFKKIETINRNLTCEIVKPDIIVMPSFNNLDQNAIFLNEQQNQGFSEIIVDCSQQQFSDQSICEIIIKNKSKIQCDIEIESVNLMDELEKQQEYKENNPNFQNNLQYQQNQQQIKNKYEQQKLQIYPESFYLSPYEGEKPVKIVFID
ncbi:hypothetical protein PPERSA_05109 [Pseudocohnilembus persalinus]|uniref:Uncharacterized protein n=1 Tax=Pseudocohnilembus persalinus TaxID=266149 RepID=A0A0V0QWV9_PSEPJ|nr:hypothetical protein PPERSA_05109 [Pseudocohnilembus persalinus]|eukprot:KRX06496.1 hypothetical protein PPERSA_05109 [Pseudocohnilembus persalinus]